MNNNERETKEIITPIDNHKVVLKSWLTGGEKRSITNTMFENTSFSSQDLKDFNLKGEMLSKIQDESIKMVVVSVDSNSENVLEKILDMKSEDYDYVLNRCTEITSGVVDEEVKKK